MARRIFKVSENILYEDIIGDLLVESFYPNYAQVIAVRDFLKKNFIFQPQDTTDANGYPTKIGVAIQLTQEGMALRTLSMRELLLMLDDKFNNFIKDENDRRSFLKQVIRDWADNNISKEGLLSVNYI